MARHITSMNIEAFRGIKDLELKDLGTVNIIVGANNCGKTSVLEAITLLSAPDSFANVLNCSRLRELNRLNPRFSTSFYDSFLYLFNRLNEELLIAVSGKTNNVNVSLRLRGKVGKVLVDLNEVMKNSFYTRNRLNSGLAGESEQIDCFVGELQYDLGYYDFLSNNSIPISFNKFDRAVKMQQKSPYINMTFISAIDHIVKNTFREITRSKRLIKNVVEILNLFDPNITDLRIISEDDGRTSQMIDNALLDYMPLSTYGDGIKKVIALANGIAQARNGILLVDEIETSIHTSALKKVFLWLINACRENDVQLFFTTHSLETVDAILNCNADVPDRDLIRVITLVKKENQTVARILTGEKALQVREDYDMELRK